MDYFKWTQSKSTNQSVDIEETKQTKQTKHKKGSMHSMCLYICIPEGYLLRSLGSKSLRFDIAFPGSLNDKGSCSQSLYCIKRLKSSISATAPLLWKHSMCHIVTYLKKKNLIGRKMSCVYSHPSATCRSRKMLALAQLSQQLALECTRFCPISQAFALYESFDI